MSRVSLFRRGPLLSPGVSHGSRRVFSSRFSTSSPSSLATPIARALSLALTGGLFVLSPLTEAAGWRAVPREEAVRAAEALLRAVVRTPHRCRTIAGHFTIDIDGPSPNAPVLVLTPGYASGSALWAPCLDELAKTHRVFAVDWLGTGASSRPAFTASTVAQGEAFFITALAEWTVAAGLGSQPFALAGHSLGGYLAGAFALAHPRLLSHLVLVNAAGMHAPPDARLRSLRERSRVLDQVALAWEEGVTPASLVRALGPLGSRFTRAIVARRFNAISAAGGNADARAAGMPLGLLAAYTHAILGGATSGERALSVIFAPFAVAKAPMGPRLLDAARTLPPITLISGAHDWIDFGDRSAAPALAAALRREGANTVVSVVDGAGHFVFLDAPDTFARIVRERVS